VTNTANTLHFLLSLLYPPFREIHPFKQDIPNRESVRETLQQVQDALRHSRDYYRMALCEFNAGLYHLHWNENQRAHHFFHKARFHGALANDDPFVCLAYFAEGCAHSQYEMNSALAVYRKAQASLHTFKDLLPTRRHGYRLTVFARGLEQQMDSWRQMLDERLRALEHRPDYRGQLVTDDERVYRWFEVNSATGALLKGFESGDWVLAEMNQQEDGSWHWRELLIISRNNRIGTIRLQPYPEETPNQPYYLGLIKEWKRDPYTNEIAFRPLKSVESDDGMMRPREIEGVVITHYREQGLIDLV